MAIGVGGTPPRTRDDTRPNGRINLFLINGFRLVIAGVDVQPSAVCQRVLAVLALRGDLPRAVAAGTLWPESRDGRSYGSLRTALWKLRRIEADLVHVWGGRLGLGDAVRVDVTALAGWAGPLIEHPAVVDAELTFGFPQGDLLPDWYEDWVLFERERLRQLRLHALDNVAAQLGTRGRYAEGIAAALEAIRLEPLRESAHRTLLSLHLAEGNFGEAVRHFREFRTLIRAELGVDPSAGMTAMIAARAPELLNEAVLTKEADSKTWQCRDSLVRAPLG